MTDAEKIKRARTLLEDLLMYLTSDKFHKPGNDYVYVTTDLLPKLIEIRGVLKK